MTPEDEPTSADDTVEDQNLLPEDDAEQVDPDGAADQDPAEGKGVEESAVEPERATESTTDEAPTPDPSTVDVDTEQLDQAQEAIEDAREAVRKVAATDSIDEEATGAGDLPAFADSAEGAEQPKPPVDDAAPSTSDSVDATGDDATGDDGADDHEAGDEETP